MVRQRVLVVLKDSTCSNAYQSNSNYNYYVCFLAFDNVSMEHLCDTPHLHTFSVFLSFCYFISTLVGTLIGTVLDAARIQSAPRHTHIPVQAYGFTNQ